MAKTTLVSPALTCPCGCGHKLTVDIAIEGRVDSLVVSNPRSAPASGTLQDAERAAANPAPARRKPRRKAPGAVTCPHCGITTSVGLVVCWNCYRQGKR